MKSNINDNVRKIFMIVSQLIASINSCPVLEDVSSSGQSKSLIFPITPILSLLLSL